MNKFDKTSEIGEKKWQTCEKSDKKSEASEKKVTKSDKLV